MPDEIGALFAERDSPDRDRAYQALRTLFELAEEPVDWAYAVWDDLLDQLSDAEGSKRAFAAQMLARLAISDPEQRMLKDFPALAAVMNDEKPVTARHTLQTLWRVGLAGDEQKAMVLEALETRYRESPEGRKGRIVRRDAITALAGLAKATADPTVEARARALIATERDDKEAKKQDAAWRSEGPPE